MNKIIVGFCVAVALVAGVFMYATSEGRRQQQQMQAALDLSTTVTLSEEGIHQMGPKVAEAGRGNIGDAREVLYWIVCSDRILTPAVESSAKAALLLVSTQNVSPKTAVTAMVTSMESIIPSGKGPVRYEHCPRPW